MLFVLKQSKLKHLLFVALGSAFLSFKVAVNKEVPNADNPTIRKLLVNALESKKTTDSLYASLTAIKNPAPLIQGYIGALEALKAKHTWNPYYKIKYISDSENTFKKAVTGDPHNIEIRFMRFSIEHNVPAFLGYTKNLVGDRGEMIKQIDAKYYASADKTLVKAIIKFLLDSKRCTADEEKNLTQHLAAL